MYDNRAQVEAIIGLDAVSVPSDNPDSLYSPYRTSHSPKWICVPTWQIVPVKFGSDCLRLWNHRGSAGVIAIEKAIIRFCVSF
jgi:hypothetical protein